MIFRIIIRLLFLILAAIAVYCAVVGIWARFSVAELVAIYPRNQNIVELPRDYVKMMLKIEDPNFYRHSGFDISVGQGKTTLTSAIAKEIFLFGGKLEGWRGKIQSFYRLALNPHKKIDLSRNLMAIILNQYLSKNEQLNFFVANVSLGSHNGVQIRGLAQASTIYFTKPLSDISKQEMIALIAMMKAPSHYHPFKNPAALKRRIGRITRLLAGDCFPTGWFDTTYGNCAGRI